MRKYLLSALSSVLLAPSVYSNEIQVFTANTLGLTPDRNASFETIYSGSYEDFNKNYAEIMKSKQISVAAQTAYNVGMMTGQAFAAGAGSIQGGSIPGLVVGVAIVAVAGVSRMAYNYITADNEYVVLNVVTNSNGATTMLQTHIVANYALSPEEVQTIAMTDQKKLIN